MAVEDKYTEASIQTQNKGVIGSGGQDIITWTGYAAIAAADDDGSKYRLFKNIPASFRPVRCTVQTTAITGGTDFELGIYQTGVGGAVVNKGLFMTGQTLASASRTLDGLSAVSLANLGLRKTVAELLGLTPTTAAGGYDVVLTGDTVGSAAGDVVVIMEGFAA